MHRSYQGLDGDPARWYVGSNIYRNTTVDLCPFQNFPGLESQHFNFRTFQGPYEPCTNDVVLKSQEFIDSFDSITKTLNNFYASRIEHNCFQWKRSHCSRDALYIENVSIYDASWILISNREHWARGTDCSDWSYEEIRNSLQF